MRRRWKRSGNLSIGINITAWRFMHTGRGVDYPLGGFQQAALPPRMKGRVVTRLACSHCNSPGWPCLTYCKWYLWLFLAVYFAIFSLPTIPSASPCAAHAGNCRFASVTGHTAHLILLLIYSLVCHIGARDSNLISRRISVTGGGEVRCSSRCFQSSCCI